MMPALARGLQSIWIGLYGFDPDITNVVMEPIYLAQVIIIVMTLVAAGLLKRLTHPATLLAVGVNAAVFLMEPMGRSDWLENVLRAIIAV